MILTFEPVVRKVEDFQAAKFPQPCGKLSCAMQFGTEKIVRSDFLRHHQL